MLKRCTRCGKMKDREQDFLKKKCKKRSNGQIKVYVYSASECRECNAERVAKWKSRKQAEGTLKDHQRRWSENRDREARRRYLREWYRRRRGDDLHHIWSKYEHELESPHFEPNALVSYIDRFLVVDEFIADNGKPNRKYRINGVSLSEVETHQLASWRRGETDRVSLEMADRWATRFDFPLWEFEEAAKMAA